MSVREFGSFDAMLDAMRDDRRFANEHRHPVQSFITFGSRVLSVMSPEALIFGEVYTEEEFIAAEMGAGAEGEEAREEWESVRSAEADGMVFGTWYSTIEPTGEIGSQNKINLWPILPHAFEAARDVGFDPARFPSWLTREMTAAASNAIEHFRAVYHR